MNAPLRIAAVGLEHDEIYRVLDRLRRHETADLVAIAERSGRLRMAAAGRYRVPVFPRLTPLLAETAVDAVIVATANGDKAAAIQEAMRAEKHVIAHAPLAITPEQLAAVEDTQSTSNTGLHLLLPLRFTASYLHLREAIAQGLLGTICQAVAINSQKVTATPRTQAFYATRRHGGVLTNLAVHDLDVLRWLGEDLTVTAAATQRHGLTEHPDFEDAGLVHCTFANGGVGVVVCNWLAPDAGEPFQELTVIGTAGTAWISGGKLHALGCNDRSSLTNESQSSGYLATQDESGRAFPPNLAAKANYDINASMLDAAIQSLNDADLRRVATADAFRTSSVAVQAQHIAWQDRG